MFHLRTSCGILAKGWTRRLHHNKKHSSLLSLHQFCLTLSPLSTTTTTTTTTTTPLPSPRDNSSINKASHDLGGQLESFGPVIIDQNMETPSEPLQQWEYECHSLFAVLGSKGIIKTDELRRAVEDLTHDQYVAWAYYEKWSAAMARLLIDKGTITNDELGAAIFGNEKEKERISGADEPKFQEGHFIRIRTYDQGGGGSAIEWRRPHLRTPGYIYGVSGTVSDVCGKFGDPSLLAYGIDAPKVWLYRVSIAMKDLWPEQTTSTDLVSVEVYEHWLEHSDSNSGHSYSNVDLFNHDDDGQDCTHHHHHHNDDHHHHHNDDDHSHDPRPFVEERAVSLEGIPRPGKDMHKAILRILVEKNILSFDEVRKMAERMDTAGEKLLGATLVLEAWKDGAFRDKLLVNAPEAALEVGIETANPNAPTILTVVENTPDVHNLIVCTLCSCYPSGLLGISPSWYRSSEYRARAVREPREVLREFGTEIPSSMSVRVHDSTADHRYLVLPQRPEGTDGWSDEKLRAIITRDCMIGVTLPKRS